MFNVEVSKECSCFKDSDLVKNQEFATMKEAMSEANRIVETANDFCGKHNFKIVEDVLGLMIVVGES